MNHDVDKLLKVATVKIQISLKVATEYNGHVTVEYHYNPPQYDIDETVKTIISTVPIV